MGLYERYGLSSARVSILKELNKTSIDRNTKGEVKQILHTHSYL